MGLEWGIYRAEVSMWVRMFASVRKRESCFSLEFRL